MKPMRLTKTLKIVVAAITAATALAIGAVAVNAGASGTNTVYYACLKSGALTKVGTTSPTCSSGYTKISWNSQGAPGTPGAAGKQGPPGPTVNTCTSPRGQI